MKKICNCEKCMHFRPLRFNYKPMDCIAESNKTADKTPNLILNFDKNGIKSSKLVENSKQDVGVCVKNIEFINDATHTMECCELKNDFTTAPFLHYFHKEKPKGSHGVIGDTLGITQYKPIKSSDRYCGTCKRWRETDYDDKDLLSVLVPYDIETSDALLCPGIEGYCLYDSSKKRSDCTGCNHHIGLYEYEDAITTDEFIPTISPKRRYINSIRLVLSLFWLELFYRNKLNDELKEKADKIGIDALKKQKELSQTINPRNYEELKPVFISKIIDCDTDTIKRHLTNEKIADSYSYYLMGAVDNYFNIPLQIIYGIKHDYYMLDTSCHSELIVTLESEYKYNNLNMVNRQPSFLYVDELFLYGISILIKVSEKEDIKNFIDSYKEYAESMRNRVSTANHDKSSIRSRVIDANGLNPIRSLSLATGISEKQTRNYYAIKNKNGEYREGKGQLTHTDLLRICDALGIPMNEIITGKKAETLNPFEHYTDEQFEYMKYSEERCYKDYLLNSVRYLYSLNGNGERNKVIANFDNELMRTIINLYRTCGIDGSLTVLKQKLLEFVRKKPELYEISIDKNAFL